MWVTNVPYKFRFSAALCIEIKVLLIHLIVSHVQYDIVVT